MTDEQRDPTGPNATADQHETTEKGASTWITWILDAAIDGVGPLEDAVRTSNRILTTAGGDKEQAIKALTTSEMKALGLSGFLSGFGGIATMPFAVPADITYYHLRAARMAACIAHLRGYDLTSPAIRSLVALTLAGDEGRRIAAGHAIEIGSFEAVGRLHDLPEQMLRDIDRAVGMRLLANAGVKGAINLVRLVPVAGGLAAGAVNLVGLRDIVTAAKLNFPRMVG